MVDYSKWDKMAADLSDEEDDDDVQSSRSSPSVTKFDQPRTLTIGNNQVKMKPQPSTSSKTATSTSTTASSSGLSNFVPATISGESSSASTSTSVGTSSSSSTAAASSLKSTTKDGENLTLNGADCGDFLWSQTRDTVQIAVPVPAGTKARAVAVHIESKAISVTLDARSILSCALAYAVDASEDAVNGCWRIIDDSNYRQRRLVLITLNKKVDVPGLIQWWSNVRATDKPIDVTAIKERQPNNNAQTFAQVWDEAHKEFLQRVKNRPPPQEIEIPHDDDDDDDNDKNADSMQQDSAVVTTQDSNDKNNERT